MPIEKMTPEFEKGLREHEDQVQRTLAEGHAKVAAELRAKAAEYLVAAYEANQRGAPRTDDFDFVPFVGELNPFFINRWRTFLDDTSDRFDPVMAPFHAFAVELGPEDFAAKADVLAKASRQTPMSRKNTSIHSWPNFSRRVLRIHCPNWPNGMRRYSTRPAINGKN